MRKVAVFLVLAAVLMACAPLPGQGIRHSLPASVGMDAQRLALVDSTVKNTLLGIMAKADNLLVIVSKITNVESPILNWQISKAVNRFHLPVIIAYVGKQHLDDNAVEDNWSRLPNKIRKYIGRDSARMAHIPLTQDKLERALGTFAVGAGTYPWNSTTIF